MGRAPGIYINEQEAAVQVIQEVSTATAAFLGYTQRGPSNKATIVTNYQQAVRRFGPPIRDSLVGHGLIGYYSNGGQRAVIVRTPPADAIAADAKIRSVTTDQSVEAGDGLTAAFAKTALTTQLKVNGGDSPIRPSSLTFRWRATGAAALAVQTKQRNGTTNLLGDGVKTKFEGRLDPADFGGTSAGVFDASRRPTDPALDVVVSGAVDVVFHWSIVGPVAKTLTIPGASSGPIVTATNADGTIIFDRRTGYFSLLTTAAVDAVANTITADYTKATTTRTLTDDGAGVLPAGLILTGAGALDYNTGAYSFTTVLASVPHDGARLLVVYTIHAWDLDPESTGAWGNDLRLDLQGSKDFFDAATASFSRFDVSIYLRNADTGLFDLKETIDEVDFADPLSADFFGTMLNDLSDLTSVQLPGADEAPGQLAGVARSHVLAGGDEVVGNQVVTSAAAGGGFLLFGATIAKRSVVITYTSATDGLVKTIREDGNGNFTGHLDTAYATAVTVGAETLAPNTMSYATGAFNFKTLHPIKVGTLVLASYYSAALETVHQERFGDTTLAYTQGTDGTFDATNYGRNQLTAPALQTTYSGIYALDRLSSLMQVVVLDFAGDVVITGDLLDYADYRATLPHGGDRFIILATPQGLDAQEAVDWFRFDLARYSKWAALYWPWVRVPDPLTNGSLFTMPAIGHVAGIYARTDRTRGVSKAPAGTVDGLLNNVRELEVSPSIGDIGLVFENKINALRDGEETGLCVWGARTISNQSSWRFVSRRRLFMFIERSIYNSTFWIVFENNGPALWSRIRGQLNAFLKGLFNQGLLKGSRPEEAFTVVVDDTNNDADSEKVVVELTVAGPTPAEDVEFRVSQVSQVA